MAWESPYSYPEPFPAPFTRPAPASPATLQLTRYSLSASRALVASSRMRTGGFRTRARAMATRCFWPPDSWAPFSPVSAGQRHRCK